MECTTLVQSGLELEMGNWLGSLIASVLWDPNGKSISTKYMGFMRVISVRWGHEFILANTGRTNMEPGVKLTKDSICSQLLAYIVSTYKHWLGNFSSILEDPKTFLVHCSVISKFKQCYILN